MTPGKSAHEVNFDCLVGPTHHFGGLSYGNLASIKNRAKLSSPKRAALQGLAKMRFLHDRGFLQGILPPHERPHMKSFRNVGFIGSDSEILHAAYKKMPEVFFSLCSSSAMWAANAATMSPSIDSLDDKAHISPANLVTMLHRSIEADFAYQVFSYIFANTDLFTVHPPLLPHDTFSDEGAANHNRLAPQHGMPGVQIFVYGKESARSSQKCSIFPARQSKIANRALITRHQLREKYYLNIEQNPLAIDQGAFHNDVVAVANQNVFLCHELAFVDQAKTITKIRAVYEELYGDQPVVIEISDHDLPLKDAISSYLFNSQILTKPVGMLLLAPIECQSNARAHAVIENIMSSHSPINEISYFDVSQSMANGGGPACLRLRMILTDQEVAGLCGRVMLTDEILNSLTRIINTYYVEELVPEHFFDARFLEDCRCALDEIATVLGLGSIYQFQR
jgi:succinylarginine dihydrolase